VKEAFLSGSVARLQGIRLPVGELPDFLRAFRAIPGRGDVIDLLNRDRWPILHVYSHFLIHQTISRVFISDGP